MRNFHISLQKTQAHCPAIPVFFLLIACLTSPLQAHAQDRSVNDRRIQVFLVPENNESASIARDLTGHFEQAIQKAENLRLISLSSMMGGKPPPEFQQTLDLIRERLDHGKRLFKELSLDQALNALRNAREMLHANAAWIGDLPEYEETLSYLAATLILLGQTDEGQGVYKRILFQNPEFKLNLEIFDDSLESFLDRARQSIADGSVGSISVTSEPPGARVFISGEEQGFTPVSISRIPTGEHILLLRNPGTIPHARIIEVTPTEDGNFQISLSQTSEFRNLQANITQVGEELMAGQVGQSMIRLGKFVDIDWAIYGVIQRTFGSINMNLWIVNINSQRRIATRRFEIPHTEFSLATEVEQALAGLLEDAWRRDTRASSSPDPLDQRKGTEEWGQKDNSKERPSLDAPPDRPTRSHRGRRSSDPLDEKDGTEGW